jgi:prevent-host-death family protein
VPRYSAEYKHGRLLIPADDVAFGILLKSTLKNARSRRKNAMLDKDVIMRDLQREGTRDILVSMTSLNENLPSRWRLQDAKARFSELVRRARSDGPQHVTVRGRDEVVVVAAEEFHRLKGDRTGAALVEAMQASPYREIDIEPRRERLPVRDVTL